MPFHLRVCFLYTGHVFQKYNSPFQNVAYGPEFDSSSSDRVRDMSAKITEQKMKENRDPK